MATTIASTPIWVPLADPITPIVVRIFCHVERLGPVYDAGWVHFSLNLSAAFDTGTNPVTPGNVKMYLKIWNWDWSQLAILGVDDKNKTVVFDPSAVTLLLDQAPPPLPSLDSALSSKMEETIKIDPTLKAFQSSAAFEGTTIDEQTRNWKGVLAHVSTFPSPLPQSSKLCVFFRVKQQAIDDAKVAEIVAAPSAFGVAGPFPNQGPQLPPTGQTWDVIDPTKPLHRDGGGKMPDYYFWAYDPTASPTITAFLNRCPTAAPSPDPGSFMNLANMWVTKSTPLSSSTPGALPPSEDWTLQLESKCADAFDFPRRVLDALQSNVQSLRDNGKLLWSVDNSFHECFLASLRDLANFGLASPPEGKKLAEAVIAYVKGPVDQFKSLLTAAEPQNYNDVASWIVTLKAFLRAVEPGTQFPELPSTSHPELLPAYARALEHLYSVLAGDPLIDFFLEEWDSVLKAHPSWPRYKPQIAKKLTDIQLRKRLALSNSGIAWRSLTGNLHERDALLNALKTALRSYFSERFGGSGTTDYKTYFPPVASKLAPEIQTSLDAYAAEFVDKVLLPQEPTPDDPATFTEDLTIQVDRLQRAQTAGSADDQSDFLRRIAGLGVLLRRKEATEWRCLSLAQMNIAGQPSGLDASPVPLRLGYRNGLRQCYLTYRNQPMAAGSPANDFSQKHEMVQGNDRKDPLLSYSNPYSATGFKLEGLVYRPVASPYVAAVFLIGNGGHLPSELAAQDQLGRKIPWRLRSTFGSVAPPFVQEIPYVRRVPVGFVRLGSTTPRGQSEMDKLALPAIPDTVLPLTRSLHVPQSDPAKDRQDALVLLTPPDDPWLPNRNTFKFLVRPPSTTLQVWDRWVAADPAKRGMRINVWARYHQFADVPDTVSKAVQPDLAIDDPAVNQIRFQFTQIYPTRGAAQTVDCPVGATSGDCSNDLKCVQSAPIQVEISSSATLNIPTVCANPLRIGIPSGQVWKLEIFPVIQDPTRFHPELAPAAGKPVTLHIEIAAPLVEGNPSDLRRLLNGALQLGLASERLQVSLKPSASNPMWDRMHRVEIMLQRWRWDGRPVCYFDWNPQNKPQVHYGLPPQAALGDPQYDGTLFASRESSDHLLLPSRVDFAASRLKKEDIYQTDLSMLPGALYFRAAIRAFSRYEGLLRSGELRDSLDSRPLSGEAEQWQRIVVPCRYKKAVPRPAVKLVLPLTQATPDSGLSPDTAQLQPGDAAGDPTALATSVTSGLIVILDESWYSDFLGGIGETFDWDIVRTALPDVPDDSRLEFGPDPILDLTDDPLAGRTVQAFPAIGAIGYTNDTDTLAPLFTRASFVLPPPSVDGIPDLSWFFLKLRFRRRLTLAPLLKADSSDWTEPVWTQLLPPSNLIQVEGQTLPLPVSRLYFDPSLPGFRDGGANGKPPVKPQSHKSGGQCVFELWLLLTRQIVDALGRRNQESFVNLVPLDNVDQLLPMPPGSVIRLIELQRRPNINIDDLEGLIKAMFPDAANAAADPPDATARIVRVFTPMSVSNK